jgi:hypothetical protein
MFFREMAGGSVRRRVPPDHHQPADHEEGRVHLKAAARADVQVLPKSGKVLTNTETRNTKPRILKREMQNLET